MSFWGSFLENFALRPHEGTTGGLVVRSQGKMFKKMALKQVLQSRGRALELTWVKSHQGGGSIQGLPEDVCGNEKVDGKFSS